MITDSQKFTTKIALCGISRFTSSDFYHWNSFSHFPGLYTPYKKPPQIFCDVRRGLAARQWRQIKLTSLSRRQPVLGVILLKCIMIMIWYFFWIVSWYWYLMHALWLKYYDIDTFQTIMILDTFVHTFWFFVISWTTHWSLIAPTTLYQSFSANIM